MTGGGHQELVIFFSVDECVQDERLFAEFDGELLCGQKRLPAFAAQDVQAAYCVVASGLVLAAAVLFKVRFDEDGAVDAEFNLPLRYLARLAGVEGSVNDYPVRVASRGKCAVPWHSLNLWEPQQPLADLLEVLQKRIYKNRLNLRPVAEHAFNVFVEEEDELATDYFDFGEPIEIGSDVAENPQRAGQFKTDRELEQWVSESFGHTNALSMPELVRLHNEQLADTQRQFQAQLRAYRQEIHELKVALRQEQSRSRRLQQILRGDP